MVIAAAFYRFFMNTKKIILWSTALILIISLLGVIHFGTQIYWSWREAIGVLRQETLQNGPEWSVHMLDVGQGDAIFVELPEGVQMLVDGGVGGAVLSRLSDVMMPWDRTIDYVVVTHPHADHINGLIEVFERYQIGSVLIDNIVYDSAPYRILQNKIADEGSVVIDPDEADVLIDGKVLVDIIYPSSDIDVDIGGNVNEGSIVLKIYDGVNSVLLTGDAGNVVEENIAHKIGDIDILKVGHHGSTYGTSREFLRVIDPEVAVISVGEDNDYGHPHLSTLKRLQDFGVEVFRTDLDGTVSLKFFGGGYRVLNSLFQKN